MTTEYASMKDAPLSGKPGIDHVASRRFLQSLATALSHYIPLQFPDLFPVEYHRLWVTDPISPAISCRHDPSPFEESDHTAYEMVAMAKVVRPGQCPDVCYAGQCSECGKIWIFGAFGHFKGQQGN